MKNFLNRVLSPYLVDKDYLSIYDEIKSLENRITVLEEENISLTNEIYRLENSLDARIDILVSEK